MEFIDLKAQQRRIRDKIEERIKNVLDHGKYILGPEVKELEEKLSNYVGRKYAVGVGSGTDALLMGLMALDVKRGDYIITTPFTFIATAEVIALLGAKPIFVDIDENTFNISPQKVKEFLENPVDKVSGKPIELESIKGIIPVDIFGLPAEYDELLEIAKEYSLFVLEDAAQSFGGKYKGRKACSFGNLAATSFFPAKPLGCYGDGGMIFTDDEELYEKLVSIRVHGKGVNKYENVRVGVNGRLDTLQAAILLAKFEIFDDEISKRQEVAREYQELLKGKYQLQYIPEYSKSAWAQFVLLSENRDKIIKNLKENDIPTAIYYPKPLHLQKAFNYLGYKEGDLPISEDVSKKIFALPMHPYLTNQKKFFTLLNNVFRG